MEELASATPERKAASDFWAFTLVCFSEFALRDGKENGWRRWGFVISVSQFEKKEKTLIQLTQLKQKNVKHTLKSPPLPRKKERKK